MIQRAGQNIKRGRHVFSPSLIRSTERRGQARRSPPTPCATPPTATLSSPTSRQSPPTARVSQRTTEASPPLAAARSQQVPPVATATASQASRPSRMDAVRALSNAASPARSATSNLPSPGDKIPVICRNTEPSQAGESSQDKSIKNLLLSLHKFNEVLSVQHSVTVSPSPVNVWSTSSSNINPVPVITNIPVSMPLSVLRFILKRLCHVKCLL